MRVDCKWVLVPIVAVAQMTTVASGTTEIVEESNLGEFKVHADVRFRVLPEPLEYRAESLKQREAWKQALELCPPVNSPEPLGSDCLSALSKYFLDEPVWDYGRLRYYDRSGLHNTINFPLGTRYDALPFGFDDYALDEIPLWRDIFDEKLEQRKKVFLQMATKPSCLELKSKGIREDMAGHCAARDLYKYSTYLHACAKAEHRLIALDKAALSSIDEVPSRYEKSMREIDVRSTLDVSLRVIENRVKEPELRNLARERMEKGYLHAFWVWQQCQPFEIELLPDAQDPIDNMIERAIGRLLGDNSVLSAVAHSRIVALEIAAHCGDEWAVRSFPISTFTPPEFLLDLVQKYPLLAHKHFGFSHRFRLQLRRDEQRLHQAKAFLLLEELAGSEVARAEYDESGLRTEIDYLLAGGEVKIPASVAGVHRMSNEENNELQIDGPLE
ncbi:MAG: hypothetical protein OXG24_01930 [Gammaproteobacteria bacterium]|nr:hypothetical protein [Gammaproteobacteria bacterium]